MDRMPSPSTTDENVSPGPSDQRGFSIRGERVSNASRVEDADDTKKSIFVPRKIVIKQKKCTPAAKSLAQEPAKKKMSTKSTTSRKVSKKSKKPLKRAAAKKPPVSSKRTESTKNVCTTALVRKERPVAGQVPKLASSPLAAIESSRVPLSGSRFRRPNPSRNSMLSLRNGFGEMQDQWLETQQVFRPRYQEHTRQELEATISRVREQARELAMSMGPWPLRDQAWDVDNAGLIPSEIIDKELQELEQEVGRQLDSESPDFKALSTDKLMNMMGSSSLEALDLGPTAISLTDEDMFSAQNQPKEQTQQVTLESVDLSVIDEEAEEDVARSLQPDPVTEMELDPAHTASKMMESIVPEQLLHLLEKRVRTLKEQAGVVGADVQEGTEDETNPSGIFEECDGEAVPIQHPAEGTEEEKRYASGTGIQVVPLDREEVLKENIENRSQAAMSKLQGQISERQKQEKLAKDKKAASVEYAKKVREYNRSKLVDLNKEHAVLLAKVSESQMQARPLVTASPAIPPKRPTLAGRNRPQVAKQEASKAPIDRDESESIKLKSYIERKRLEEKKRKRLEQAAKEKAEKKREEQLNKLQAYSKPPPPKIPAAAPKPKSKSKKKVSNKATELLAREQCKRKVTIVPIHPPKDKQTHLQDRKDSRASQQAHSASPVSTNKSRPSHEAAKAGPDGRKEELQTPADLKDLVSNQFLDLETALEVAIRRAAQKSAAEQAVTAPESLGLDDSHEEGFYAPSMGSTISTIRGDPHETPDITSMDDVLNTVLEMRAQELEADNENDENDIRRRLHHLQKSSTVLNARLSDLLLSRVSEAEENDASGSEESQDGDRSEDFEDGDKDESWSMDSEDIPDDVWDAEAERRENDPLYEEYEDELDAGRAHWVGVATREAEELWERDTRAAQDQVLTADEVTAAMIQAERAVYYLDNPDELESSTIDESDDEDASFEAEQRAAELQQFEEELRREARENAFEEFMDHSAAAKGEHDVEGTTLSERLKSLDDFGGLGGGLLAEMAAETVPSMMEMATPVEVKRMLKVDPEDLLDEELANYEDTQVDAQDVQSIVVTFTRQVLEDRRQQELDRQIEEAVAAVTSPIKQGTIAAATPEKEILHMSVEELVQVPPQASEKSDHLEEECKTEVDAVPVVTPTKVEPPAPVSVDVRPPSPVHGRETATQTTPRTMGKTSDRKSGELSPTSMSSPRASDFEKKALSLIRKEATHLADLMQFHEAERKRIMAEQVEIESRRAENAELAQKREMELEEYHKKVIAELQAAAQQQILSLQAELTRARDDTFAKELRARELERELQEQRARLKEEEQRQIIDRARADAARALEMQQRMEQQSQALAVKQAEQMEKQQQALMRTNLDLQALQAESLRSLKEVTQEYAQTLAQTLDRSSETEKRWMAEIKAERDRLEKERAERWERDQKQRAERLALEKEREEMEKQEREQMEREKEERAQQRRQKELEREEALLRMIQEREETERARQEEREKAEREARLAAEREQQERREREEKRELERRKAFEEQERLLLERHEKELERLRALRENPPSRGPIEVKIPELQAGIEELLRPLVAKEVSSATEKALQAMKLPKLSTQTKGSTLSDAKTAPSPISVEQIKRAHSVNTTSASATDADYSENFDVSRDTSLSPRKSVRMSVSSVGEDYSQDFDNSSSRQVQERQMMSSIIEDSFQETRASERMGEASTSQIAEDYSAEFLSATSATVAEEASEDDLEEDIEVEVDEDEEDIQVEDDFEEDIEESVQQQTAAYSDDFTQASKTLGQTDDYINDFASTLQPADTAEQVEIGPSSRMFAEPMADSVVADSPTKDNNLDDSSMDSHQLSAAEESVQDLSAHRDVLRSRLQELDRQKSELVKQTTLELTILAKKQKSKRSRISASELEDQKLSLRMEFNVKKAGIEQKRAAVQADIDRQNLLLHRAQREAKQQRRRTEALRDQVRQLGESVASESAAVDDSFTRDVREDPAVGLARAELESLAAKMEEKQLSRAQLQRQADLLEERKRYALQLVRDKEEYIKAHAQKQELRREEQKIREIIDQAMGLETEESVEEDSFQIPDSPKRSKRSNKRQSTKQYTEESGEGSSRDLKSNTDDTAEYDDTFASDRVQVVNKSHSIVDASSAYGETFESFKDGEQEDIKDDIDDENYDDTFAEDLKRTHDSVASEIDTFVQEGQQTTVDSYVDTFVEDDYQDDEIAGSAHVDKSSVSIETETEKTTEYTDTFDHKEVETLEEIAEGAHQSASYEDTFDKIEDKLSGSHSAIASYQDTFDKDAGQTTEVEDEVGDDTALSIKADQTLPEETMDYEDTFAELGESKSNTIAEDTIEYEDTFAADKTVEIEDDYEHTFDDDQQSGAAAETAKRQQAKAVKSLVQEDDDLTEENFTDDFEDPSLTGESIEEDNSVTQPEASIVDECASVSFAVDRSKEDSIESEVGQQSSQYEDTFVGTDVEGTKDSVAYDNTFADETNQTHDTVAYDDTFAKLSTAYEDTFIEGDEENVDKTKSFVDDEGDDGYADTFMEDSKTEMPSYENTFVEAEDTDEPVLAQAPAKEPVKVNKDKTELADRVTAMVFEDLMVGLLGDVVTVAGTQQARAGALDDRATVTSAFPQQQGGELLEQRVRQLELRLQQQDRALEEQIRKDERRQMELQRKLEEERLEQEKLRAQQDRRSQTSQLVQDVSDQLLLDITQDTMMSLLIETADRKRARLPEPKVPNDSQSSLAYVHSPPRHTGAVPSPPLAARGAPVALSVPPVESAFLQLNDEQLQQVRLNRELQQQKAREQLVQYVEEKKASPDETRQQLQERADKGIVRTDQAYLRDYTRTLLASIDVRTLIQEKLSKTDGSESSVLGTDVFYSVEHEFETSSGVMNDNQHISNRLVFDVINEILDDMVCQLRQPEPWEPENVGEAKLLRERVWRPSDVDFVEMRVLEKFALMQKGGQANSCVSILEEEDRATDLVNELMNAEHQKREDDFKVTPVLEEKVKISIADGILQDLLMEIVDELNDNKDGRSNNGQSSTSTSAHPIPAPSLSRPVIPRVKLASLPVLGGSPARPFSHLISATSPTETEKKKKKKKDKSETDSPDKEKKSKKGKKSKKEKKSKKDKKKKAKKDKKEA